MRKIVWFMSVTLDGYMEGPDHDISWHLISPELHQYMNDTLRHFGVFADGRRTWELMADFWPTADEDPDNPPEIREFAGIWKEKQKIVYSRTLQQAGWNTTIVRDVVPAEVEALKAQPGGDIGLGGAELGAAFMRLDLIDEYGFFVNPIVLGAGTRMLPEITDRVDLEFVEARPFDNGVVYLRYARVR